VGEIVVAPRSALGHLSETLPSDPRYPGMCDGYQKVRFRFSQVEAVVSGHELVEYEAETAALLRRGSRAG